MMIYYYTILQISFALMTSVYANNVPVQQKCEAISTLICENVSYNFTTFPNEMNHQTQTEAHTKIIRFSWLIDLECSRDIRFFVCSVYMPICMDNYHKPLKPCRSVCQRTYNECIQYWDALGFEWPTEMDCERFPDDTHDICVIPDNFEDGLWLNKLNNNFTTEPNKIVHDTTETSYIRIWINVWSAVCIICTVAVLITLTMDTNKHLDKSIIFILLCSLLVAVGFLFAGFSGHNKHCNGDAIESSTLPCHTTFIMIYFFGMASLVWWVILTFNWFLADGLKWCDQSIERYQPYFHCVSWLLPIVQTILVFWRENIDVDPVSGICSVDSLSIENQKMFVIIPSITLLTIGSALLSAGFLLQNHGVRKTTNRQRFTISMLYMIPALFIIACQVYEMTFYDGINSWNRSNNEFQMSTFQISLILLKHFMTFSFGTLLSICIWIEIFRSGQHFRPQIITYDRIYSVINYDSK